MNGRRPKQRGKEWIDEEDGKKGERLKERLAWLK